MGSMIDQEYMTMFLDLFRYLPFIKDEKAKVKIFFSGFPLAFKDWIKYNEPQSLKDVIGKLMHCYEQSKCKT